VQRRRFLATTAAAGAVTLAGCSTVLPAPEIVESNASGSLLGPTTFEFVVENGGAGGDVTVTLTIYGQDETVQSKHGETVSMDAGERREVSFEVDIESEAERYSGSAKPALPF